MQKRLIQGVQNLMTVFFILTVCVHGQPGYPTGEPENSSQALTDSVKQVLRSLLPEANTLSLEPLGESAFYSQDLWNYMNGGAEAYHAQGFENLIHQVYRNSAAELTVDIYNMGTPLQAFGIYAAERSPDYSFSDIGLEGHGDAYALNFLQGSFYVKMSVYSENEAMNLPLMKNFAEALSLNLGPKGAWPGVLTLFPDSQRVARSEKYISHAPLGQPFLSPVFLVRYFQADTVCTLMLSEGKEPEDSRVRAEKLAAHFRMTGSVRQENGYWYGVNPYTGNLVFAPSGRYLVLLQSPFEGAMSLFEQLKQNVRAEQTP